MKEYQGKEYPMVVSDEHGPLTQEQIDVLKASPQPVPKDVEIEEVKPPPKNHFVCDQIEALLGPHQDDTRQGRRRFKRLVEKHWPLSPDEKRHPRTKVFVDRYKAMTETGK